MELLRRSEVPKLEAPGSDEHLRALGKITTNFAMLEEVVSVCIWGLIGEEQRLGRVITTELSFSRKVDLLSSLYRYRINSAEKLSELNELLNQLALAEEKRNSITHSHWGAGSTKQTITRIKATAKRGAGLKFQFEKMNVDDLNEIADFIAKLAYTVLKFGEPSI